MTVSTTETRTGVRLPVLLSVELTNYQLYPGKDGKGIHFTFRPGITVVAGINGLGKTTLLQALYRVLTGPADSGIQAGTGILGAQHVKITRWVSPQYFRARVQDDAHEAQIVVDVAFGDRRVRIGRSLRSLKLTSLRADESPQDASEVVYQRLMCELSGIARFEDFLLALQYLVFVTENRPALVWDPTAQFEMFRLLVGEGPRAREIREQFDEVQRVDSTRRNLRAQRSRIENALRTARLQQQGSREIQMEAMALEKELQSVEAVIATIAPDLGIEDDRRRDLREQLAQIRLDADESMWNHAALEQQHFRHVFPSVSETAALVFLRSDSGCLVCGDRTSRAQERIQQFIQASKCPFCESAVPETEPGVVPASAVDIMRLDEAGAKLRANRDAIRVLEMELDNAVTRHQELATRLAEAQRLKAGLRETLRGKAAQLPPPPDHLERLNTAASAIETQLEELQSDQRAKEALFAKSLDQLRTDVEKLQIAFQQRFSHFAGAFLSEECVLVYDPDDRRIGQEGERFKFPRFLVRMTNALSPTQGRPRSGPLDVSESQREFIDLAFRMALLDVTTVDGAAMLVLETPEASLDQIFVGRAGQLLRDFAFAGQGVGNRLIATSNLTDGHMIGALLGSISSNGKLATPPFDKNYVPPDERESRIINLLVDAAPSKALRDFRSDYEAAFLRAVYPERNAPSAYLSDASTAAK